MVTPDVHVGKVNISCTDPADFILEHPARVGSGDVGGWICAGAELPELDIYLQLIISKRSRCTSWCECNTPFCMGSWGCI